MDVLCEERPHAIDRFPHRLDPRHLVDRHDDAKTVLQLRHEFERLEGIETQVGGLRCHRQLFPVLAEKMTSLDHRTASSRSLTPSGKKWILRRRTPSGSIPQRAPPQRGYHDCAGERTETILSLIHISEP